MGRCSSKLTTIHSIRHVPLDNKFQQSKEKFLSGDSKSSNQNTQVSKSPRNMVLPHSKRFDINYTTIPNKIHKKPSAWDNQIFGLVGLKNLGNTCFMNSALQCLLNVVPLTDYFLSDLHLQEINVENFLGSKGELSHFIWQIWENNQLSEISPKEFYSAFSDYAPQFSYGTQEDSHDFLAILLDVIHEDLNRVKQRPVVNDSEPEGKSLQEQAANAWKNHLLRNRSIIVDLFQSQIKSSLKCHECGFVSYKFEPFMYLSLPIPENSKKEITLYQCLDEFIKEEKLEKEERWHCPKCKEPKDSSKKIEIWTLPNILIIHLKRFKFTRQKRGKIRSVVDFPVVDLDLTSYLGHPQRDKPIYDLFAISCHEGTLGGGHYTSYIKNRDTSSWYFFNDSFVKEVDSSRAKMVDSTGYVLFYSKTSVEAFARQTISDPAAWPHFTASRRVSINETIMQSEPPSPSKNRKGSAKKMMKQIRKEGTMQDGDDSSQSISSIRTPSQRNQYLAKELEHNLQINNIDLPFINGERSMTNLDINFERPKLQKKKSKVKQAVLVLPKDLMEAVDSSQFPHISPGQGRNLPPIEMKTSGTKTRYEIKQIEKGMGDPLPASSGVKTQSHFQVNFSHDMNEQSQAKPVLGISPKFKANDVKSQSKTPGFKAFD